MYEFKVSTIHRAPYLPSDYKDCEVANLNDEIDLSDMDINECRQVVYFNKRLGYYGVNKYTRVK